MQRPSVRAALEFVPALTRPVDPYAISAGCYSLSRLVSAWFAHYDEIYPRMFLPQSRSPIFRGFPECHPVGLAAELDLPPCSCSCAGSRARACC